MVHATVDDRARGLPLAAAPSLTPGRARPHHRDNAQRLARREALLDQLDDLEAIHLMAGAPETAAALDRLHEELDRVHAELVQANTGLVIRGITAFVAHTTPANVEDLHAAARLGLWTAVCSYDPDRGTFAAWAGLVIRRTVHQAVNALDHPTLSAADFAVRPRVRRAVDALRPADRDAPVDRDLVAATAGCTRGQVDMVLDPPTVESLSRPVRTDGTDVTLQDVLSVRLEGEGEDPADLAVERTMAAEALHVVAERLQGRERRIVVRRFGLDGQPPASRAEIGREMGISREMVRRLELRALAVVRESVLERSA